MKKKDTYWKKYYAKNADRLKQRARERYWKAPELYREQSLAYSRSHSEERKEYGRRRYQEHLKKSEEDIAREYQEKHVNLVCRECEQEFTMLKSQTGESGRPYCSMKCRKKFTRKHSWKQITCEHCGKKFEVRKEVSRKFCSRKCYHIAKVPLRVLRHCGGCGKQIWVRKARAKLCSNSYCSMKCVNRMRKTRWEKLTCRKCGKEFSMAKCRIRSGTGEFCSLHCSQTFRRGSEHPNWRGGSEQVRRYGSNWKLQRGKALKRDGYKCILDGHTEDLHVHHLIAARLYKDKRKANSLRNLITLCRKCHSKVEWGQLTISNLKAG